MKTLMSFLAAAILAAAAIPTAEARVAVSVDFFYSNLDPYGSWREVGDYGYCWRPNDAGSDWSPYSDGRWVYTDAGWTWDSDEPYGWAVYHYGRWANVGQVGWVWVPGTEWGPGWVSWRHSSRYVGWAPLPPEARFRPSLGLSVWVDDYYDIGPGSFRFVEGRNFGNRRLNSVFVDRRENISIIHQTTNITNITYVNNVVHNGGMDYERQSRQSSTPINRYKLDRRQDFDGDPGKQRSEQLRSRVSGDSLSMQAPSFTEGSSVAPAKVSKKIEKADVNHGWKNAGSSTEIATARTGMKSKVPAPRELPAEAKYEKAPRRVMDEQPKHETDRGPAKVETPSQARPNKKNKIPDKETRPSVPERKPEADKPRRPHADDVEHAQHGKSPPPADSPKHADKIRKSDPPQARPDEMPKSKNQSKPASKNGEPKTGEDHGKDKPGKKDKEPSDEAPKQNP